MTSFLLIWFYSFGSLYFAMQHVKLHWCFHLEGTPMERNVCSLLMIGTLVWFQCKWSCCLSLHLKCMLYINSLANNLLSFSHLFQNFQIQPLQVIDVPNWIFVFCFIFSFSWDCWKFYLTFVVSAVFNFRNVNWILIVMCSGFWLRNIVPMEFIRMHELSLLYITLHIR
jgi:hypothetical protein